MSTIVRGLLVDARHSCTETLLRKCVVSCQTSADGPAHKLETALLTLSHMQTFLRRGRIGIEPEPLLLEVL